MILKIYRALAITKSFHKFYLKHNKDLILSALLLKYIGRVKQYKYDLIFSFSDIGDSEHYFILSRDIIKNFSSQISNFPKNMMNQLIDIVMYNHNSKSESGKNHTGELIFIIYELEKSLFLNKTIE